MSSNEKKKLIDSLLKKVQEPDFEKMDKKIRKKFGSDMDEWKMIHKKEDIMLERGYFVRYVDLRLERYRTALLLSTNRSKSGVIKTLTFKNVYNGLTWIITPQNYYFYKYSAVRKSALRKWLEEIMEKEKDLKI